MLGIYKKVSKFQHRKLVGMFIDFPLVELKNNTEISMKKIILDNVPNLFQYTFVFQNRYIEVRKIYLQLK